MNKELREDLAGIILGYMGVIILMVYFLWVFS